MFKTAQDRFRFFAIAEGISCILLFLVAMPLKYGLKMESAIKVPGMVHGLLFLAYIGFTFLLFLKEKWRFGKLLTGWACGFVPLATFWFEGRVRREAVLAR